MADESNIQNVPIDPDTEPVSSEPLDNDSASTDASEDRNKEDSE